jgi:hypothetical protein
MKRRWDGVLYCETTQGCGPRRRRQRSAALQRRQQLSVCQSVAAAKPTKMQCWSKQMGNKTCDSEHWKGGHIMGMSLNGVKATTVPNEIEAFR